MQDGNNYTGEQIQYLEGLEPVRKRPGMYIGSTGVEGLHHMVTECVDNSVDEALAGYCSKINIKILPDNIIEVEDDGRGIPVDIHPTEGISSLELVMTKLHAGAKMDDRSAYKVSGGLHGVGVSVVNALSESFEVYVKREGKIHYQKFQRGEPIGPVEVIGETTETGTKEIFKADPEIFSTLEYSFDTLSKKLRELAFLNAGLRIHIEDLRDEEKIKEHDFYYEGGIVSFLEHFNKAKEAIHKPTIYYKAEKDFVEVEFAIQYNSEYSENIYTYVNNINTVNGGTHLSGFKSAMTRTMNELLKRLNLDKKLKDTLSGDDTREGISTVLSVKMPDPQFEGQTKGKLGNSEIRGIVDSIVTEGLQKYFDQYPFEIKKILEKAIFSFNVRQKVREAKERARRKNAFDNISLPGKLADCSETDPSISELYLVEGDSAGGSAKQGRNREFQAILPLWGKMLNVEKAREDKVLDNDKLQPVIATIGTGIGKDFDYSKLRYGKIIIMADADVDGSHIRTLLLTFFYKYMKELVERGHVYIAMPPLYKIQQGKKIQYAYNDKEREKIMFEIKSQKEKANINIQRYKGLGEMNPTQLWETTMNPEQRNIIKISLEDTVEADEIFSVLMGDKVEPRREFIEKYARNVKNLDI